MDAKTNVAINAKNKKRHVKELLYDYRSFFLKGIEKNKGRKTTKSVTKM